MFKRKWYGVLTVFVALGVGVGLLFLRPKMENQEPIRIYKVVTPDAKPSPTKSSMVETEVATFHSHDHNEVHNHEHFHEAVPHSHTEETTLSSDKSDWRDDSVFDSSPSKVDPWEQAYPEQESTDTDDTYPPEIGIKRKIPSCGRSIFMPNFSSNLETFLKFTLLVNTI